MAEHQEALRTVFAEMREPWWNEDILEDVDTDTDRRLEAESRRKRQGASYKTFPNQGFVEVIFMLLHCFALVFVPCYLILGVTLIGWVSSVQAITQDDQALTPSIFNQTLVGDGSYNMNAVGVLYIVYTLFLLVISLLTLKAVYSGNAGRVKIYLLVNFVGLLWEIIMLIVARYHAPMNSCELGSLKDRLVFQMEWYGLIAADTPVPDPGAGKNKTRIRFFGYEAVLKMNSLQEALGCCGINDYKDYNIISENSSWIPAGALKANYSIRPNSNPYTRHRELESIPHTCCRPIWRENIYCAEKIDDNEDLVSQRINENGCFREVQKLCENVLYMINITTLRIILLRILFFMFAVWILWYILQMLAWEKIEAFEALLEMQRPNLAGFDLADAIAKLKPITSETQALPGQRLSKKKFDRLMSVVSSAGQPLTEAERKESIWDEHHRMDKMKFYKAKTSEQIEKFSSILKDELGEIPAHLNLEEAAKHHHHHHHHGHHHQKSETALEDFAGPGEGEKHETANAGFEYADENSPGMGETGNKPTFKTLSTVLGRVASGIRQKNKVHPSKHDQTTPESNVGQSPRHGQGYGAKDLQSHEAGVASAGGKSRHNILPLFSEDTNAASSEAVLIFDTDHENFDIDEKSEHNGDADDEEDFNFASDSDRRDPYSHPMSHGTHAHTSAAAANELQKVFAKSLADRSQGELVQALAARTSEFEDRTTLIAEETEPQGKGRHVHGRKRKKKTRSKKTKPKKPQEKRSWDDFWWAGH